MRKGLIIFLLESMIFLIQRIPSVNKGIYSFAPQRVSIGKTTEENSKISGIMCKDTWIQGMAYSSVPYN